MVGKISRRVSGVLKKTEPENGRLSGCWKAARISLSGLKNQPFFGISRTGIFD
jgi:hypothetical protein